jgi:aspartate dehydrogenase
MTLLRVGLIGFGSIGATVATELAGGAVPGAQLSAVLRRTPNAHPSAVNSVAELVDRCDVVVEAAGPAVLRDIADEVLAAGRDLVAVSVGGLLESGPLDRLSARGRLVMCSGAVGALDLVRAATFAGPLTRLRITSRKAPSSLLRPWMDAGLTARLVGLRAGDEPVELFAGKVAKAVELFPNNVNVAATLAFAAGDPDLVEVRVIADPAADRTLHVVEVASAVGDYRFEIANVPSPVNPASSAVVAYSVLRCIADLRPIGSRVG